ncbi:GNAT family N-acetyltransferase [Natronomonas sp.]|uniref:GNAT family N-acetyltransferase n=1 Tax=Natronomonas sp. TaxID=2184060 RepID=UPI00262E8A88|nr:GNAT family N-acetyltransferase [Natronomonas sp.]
MTADVRPAGLEDTDAIAAVAEDAWYAAYGGFLDPSTIAAALEAYYDPSILEAAVAEDAIGFYVAVEEGEGVVGFASVERTWADEAELHTLYVHPDRWGDGIGSALLERATERAVAQGVDRVACGVLADNAVGVGFFESRGFERGRTTDAEIAGERHPELGFERRV